MSWHRSGRATRPEAVNELENDQNHLCIFQLTPDIRMVPVRGSETNNYKQTIVFHPSCLCDLFAAVLHDFNKLG